MNAKQEELYNLYKNSPPVGCYNGISVAYHNGLKGLPNLRYVKNCLSYAAWKAGRDAAISK